MSIINLARRRLLGGLLSAPIAAPLVGRAVAETAIRDIGWATESATVLGPGAVGASAWSIAGLSKLVWKSLAREREMKQLKMSREAVYRQGALDSDLACLNSLSMSYRLCLQRQRDTDRWRELDNMQRKMWPDND